MSTGDRFVDRLANAARENPLAAALIGGGLLWLVVGNWGLAGAAKAAGSAASPLLDLASRGSQANDTSTTEREVESDSRQKTETASPADTGVVRHLRETAQERWSSVRDQVSDLPDPRPVLSATYDEARSVLADVLDRQPLVLGVVGLGIGAAMAGAFSSTSPERELMGPFSDVVRSDLAERASAVGDSLKEGAETIKRELSDTGAETIDRLQQVGKDAIGAAREKAGV